MEADLPIIAPTHYDLSGRNIHISYSTTGVDGQPHFTYQDLQQTRSFSGDQIRRVETEVAYDCQRYFCTQRRLWRPYLQCPDSSREPACGARRKRKRADLWHYNSSQVCHPTAANYRPA